MAKNQPANTTNSGSADFIAVAKGSGGDDDEKAWEARPRALAESSAGSKVVVGNTRVLTPADLESGAYEAELRQMRDDERSFRDKAKLPAKLVKKGE